MSPSAAAPRSRVGQRVTHDVAVRVAERSLRGRNRHSRQDQRPFFDQSMEIVARADTRQERGDTSSRRERHVPIVHRGDLHVLSLSGHESHLIPGTLDERGFIRCIATRLASNLDGSLKDVPMESLRRLRKKNALAWKRPLHQHTVAGARREDGLLHCIVCRQRGNGCTRLARRIHDALDECLAGKGSRRIMHDDHVGRGRNPLECVGN